MAGAPPKARAGTSHTVLADNSTAVIPSNHHNVYIIQSHNPVIQPPPLPPNALTPPIPPKTASKKEMSLDLRPILTNATAEVLQEILEDHALRAEILWAFVVLLHFAALLPLDPMFVHVFVCLLAWAGGNTRGRDEGMLDWVYGSGDFADCVVEGFYRGIEGRLGVDSGVGRRGLV